MRSLMLGIALCGLVTTVFGISPQAFYAKALLEGNVPATEAPAAPIELEALIETEPTAVPTAAPTAAPAPTVRPLVQFAICLDTSGSMKGLIDSARQKLWAITNELALATPAPRLEVALLTFGNDGHNAENGWVAKHLDFTQDLDAVSELLFSFVTNGGTELVGRVLQAAEKDLSWDDSAQTLRLVFVAGNESADQDGQVPYRDAAGKLIARDIQVSSIYCGNADDPLAPGWREVALRGDGHFASIDQNQGTLTIPTPFDADLTRLGTELNATYVPYGSAGARGMWNQQAQDSNAASLNCDAAASRASCKATSNYLCAWDLVDMIREKQIEVTKIVITDLPENLQSLTIEQVVTHVNSQQVKRNALQAQIQELTAKRQAFIDAEMAKRQLTGENAFDTAVRQAIRERARRKGMSFPTDAPQQFQPQVPVNVLGPVNGPMPAANAKQTIEIKVTQPTENLFYVGLSDSGC